MCFGFLGLKPPREVPVIQKGYENGCMQAFPFVTLYLTVIILTL